MATEKAKELLKDKKFLEELKTKTSMEDVQKLFQSNGFEFSLNELTAFFKKATGSELNNEALDAVAGGGVRPRYKLPEDGPQYLDPKNPRKPKPVVGLRI